MRGRVTVQRNIPYRCGGKVGRRNTKSTPRKRCAHRASFPADPNKLDPVPRCSKCGAAIWYIDSHRLNRRDRAPVCNCTGYPFPHGVACGRRCKQHPVWQYVAETVANYLTENPDSALKIDSD